MPFGYVARLAVKNLAHGVFKHVSSKYSSKSILCRLFVFTLKHPLNFFMGRSPGVPLLATASTETGLYE